MPCANEGALLPENGEESCSFAVEETPTTQSDTSSIGSARIDAVANIRTNNAKVISLTNGHSGLMPYGALCSLPGEDMSEAEKEYCGDMVRCRLYVSPFRIVIATHDQRGLCVIPTMAVDSVEAKDLVVLQINCKDGRVFRIRAANAETALLWYKRLTQKTCAPRKLDDLFAFKFCAEVHRGKTPLPSWLRKDAGIIKRPSLYEALYREFKAQGFRESQWRISSANKEFHLCPTYPPYLIIPTCVSDDFLKNMKRGRFFNRFPTAVWRSRQNGAVLLRSAQPEISFFGAASEDDVDIFNKIRSLVCTEKKSKMLIVDARSYTAAWANRAKGGGFETSDSYVNADVQFMGLPNIHNIRYSFHQLRNLLSSSVDQSVYLQSLQATQWFQYLANLIAASDRCVDTLCIEGLSVLVHCSDGWDRTSQIVSLCKLIADPAYRTFEGFEQLVKREWIEFGHKFADRNGVLNGDNNERSPVFLQWLDCVHQLWLKNSDAFEFNQRYLMKLAQHSYSGMFGNFLFNSVKDAASQTVIWQSNDEVSSNAETEDGVEQFNPVNLFFVWDYLGKHNHKFVNPAYTAHRKQRLTTPKALWEITLWKEVYCCTDIEAIVNNPDEDMLVGTNSSHPLEQDKATMSRSQSASSLTSLEQNASHLMGNAHLNGTVGPLSVSPSVSSCSTYVSRGSDSSQTTGRFQDFMDEDGLTKVPISYEDRVVELHQQLLQLELSRKQLSNGDVSFREGARFSGDPFNSTSSTIASTTRRNRQESIDSSGFGFEVVDSDVESYCRRQKHDSCGASSSCSGVGTIPEGSRIRCCSKTESTSNGHCMSLSSTTIVENGGISHTHLAAEPSSGCAECVETMPTRSSEQIVVG
jgi:myotubularin-related protein 3/4